MARKLDKQQLEIAQGVLEGIESFYPTADKCALLPIPTLVRALGFEDEPGIIHDAIKHLLSVEAVEVYLDNTDAPPEVQRLQMPGPVIGARDPEQLAQIRVLNRQRKKTGEEPAKRPPLPRARLGFVRPKQVLGEPICGAGGCERFDDQKLYGKAHPYPPLCCEPDLKSYDLIAVNSSGGKDSQAMLDAVYRRCCQLGIEDRIVVYHADLRRVEWPGSKEVAEIQAQSYGLPFRSAAKSGYDSMLERIESRGEWPAGIGENTQFCTSEFKRTVVTSMYGKDTQPMIEKLRGTRKVRVLNCIGVRAEESPRRAKMTPFKEASTQHGTNKTTRQVDNWYPIFYWTPAEVWDVISRSGVPHHWAYDIGMPRLSCVFCVFGNRDALMLAGLYNPELLKQYVDMERHLGTGTLERCPQHWDMIDGCVPSDAAAKEHRSQVRLAKKEGRKPPRLPVGLDGKSCKNGLEPGKVCVATEKGRARAIADGKDPNPKPARDRHWKFTADLTIEEIQDALEAGEVPGEDVEIDSQL